MSETTTRHPAPVMTKFKWAEKIAMRRVEKGARLMDAKRPGWWRTVTLRDLDMADARVCVLGQNFDGAAQAILGSRYESRDDNYTAGRKALGLMATGADERHGFDVDFGYVGRSDPKKFASEDEAYEFLKQCWAAEIAARRRASRTTARTNV